MAELVQAGAARARRGGQRGRRGGGDRGRLPATSWGAFPPQLPAGRRSPLLAHLDTVPVTGPIEVELVDGHLGTAHPTILGGDDKAAVAVMIEAMRRVRDEGLPHAGVELVFTPCEEIGLRGALALDPSALVAGMGFVFDHTGPVGHLVASAPSLHKIQATFIGRAAHAGILLEAGRSAIEAAARAIGRMPLGRIDQGDHGPTLARSRAARRPTWWPSGARSWPRPQPRRAEDLVVQLTFACSASPPGRRASARSISRPGGPSSPHRLTEDDPQVRMALEVLISLGHRSQVVASGGAPTSTPSSTTASPP